MATSGDLDIDDLKDIKSALWATRAKWRNIGECIGVDEATLDTIKGKDDGENLSGVLSHWLRGVYDSKKKNSKPRTWCTLIEALRDEIVNEGAMANKLEREKPGDPDTNQDHRSNPPDEPSATHNLTFSSSMSVEDFFKWLRSKGINDKDCKTLSDSGITPSGFLECDVEDFDDIDLTKIGKKLFLRNFTKVKGSGVCIIEENSDSERMYYIQLFYRSDNQQRLEIHIIFVWYTEKHLHCISQQYPEDKFHAGCHSVVELERKEIEVMLDRAKWTVVMKDRWEIHPLQPIVTKAELDKYIPGRVIPSCVLVARPLCEDFPDLLLRIILKGIKPPHDEVILFHAPSRMNIDVCSESQSLTFSKDMSSKQLAQWLRNHPSLSGDDYEGDIIKLKAARINGSAFLSLNESGWQDLDVSPGFIINVMKIIKDIHASEKQPSTSQ